MESRFPTRGGSFDCLLAEFGLVVVQVRVRLRRGDVQDSVWELDGVSNNNKIKKSLLENSKEIIITK